MIVELFMDLIVYKWSEKRLKKVFDLGLTGYDYLAAQVICEIG